MGSEGWVPGLFPDSIHDPLSSHGGGVASAPSLLSRQAVVATATATM